MKKHHTIKMTKALMGFEPAKLKKMLNEKIMDFLLEATIHADNKDASK